MVAFFAASWAYWVPAHAGTDQNGYLVGGKLFAATLSTGFRPDGPFAFVGRMWVQAADGRCFPKYPLGLSAVYAALLKVGGPRWGVRLCFGVNPVAMAAALAGTFAVIRRLAGSSLAALLGLLIVATSPVCVGLTDNPNSHATALCCVTWGMVCLLGWRDRRGVWRAAAAGLLLGAAVTIRYTEGLLLLPAVVVAAMNVRRADRRSWAGAAALLAAWAVPVGLLAAYNLHSMRTLTGYDPTNESTGFSLANAAANWDTMARELSGTGLFFTLPFALLGAVVMWRRDWRSSLVLALWAGPNLALYTAYYWAPDDASISYLRFTLTVFPALAAMAVIGLGAFTAGRGPLATVAAGLVVAVGCGVGLYTALGNASAEAVTNAAVLRSSQAIRAVAPAGAVVFGPDRVLNYLQLTGDYQLYDTQQFSAAFVRQLGTVDPNAPTGLQPQRARAIFDAHRADTEGDLLDDEAKLASAALSAGRRVFVVEAVKGRSTLDRLAARGRFTARVVGGWDEVPEPKPGARRKPTVAGRRAGQPEAVAWQVVELRAGLPLALPSRRGRHRAA